MSLCDMHVACASDVHAMLIWCTCCRLCFGEDNLIACRVVYHLSVPEAVVSRITGLLMSLVVNPEVVYRRRRLWRWHGS